MTRSDDLISEREVAEIVNLPLPTLRSWRRAGRLPQLNPIKVGRSIVYRRDEVLRAIGKEPS